MTLNMDDMDKLEDFLIKAGRTINKYHVAGENPGWCLHVETDDAQKYLVFTFDQYGRLNKIL